MPDVISYSSVISACDKGEQWLMALSVLSSMEDAAVRPNAISFNSAISACAKVGQWLQALELLKRMEFTDVISYSGSISACERGRQWEMALVLLRSAHCEPDVICYSSAISACEKNGQWQQALQILQQMKRMRRVPNVISYSSAISACEKGGQWLQALQLFHVMSAAKLEVDRICFNSLIAACESQWSLALELFTMLGQPNLISYNGAMGACQSCGEWFQTLQLFQELRKSDLSPDVISFEIVLRACEDGRQEIFLLRCLDDARRSWQVTGRSLRS